MSSSSLPCILFPFSFFVRVFLFWPFSLSLFVMFLEVFFFLFLLLELASTMAEFSGYCWYFDRNSVYCLVFDINLHQFPAIGEVRGDVMVGHQCHRCGSWRSLNMHMTNGIVQTAHFFCSVVCVFQSSSQCPLVSLFSFFIFYWGFSLLAFLPFSVCLLSWGFFWFSLSF